MPNTPNQLPNIDLPGAEYFSLSPNRTVALQGRRRFTVQTTNQSIAASAVVVINEGTAGTGPLIMETPFPQNSGVYIHKADLLVVFGDTSGLLKVVGGGMGFRTTNSLGSAYYPLGFPFLTINTLAGFQQQSAISDRDILVAERDIEAYSGGSVSPSQLQAAFMLTVQNTDAGAAHFVEVFYRCVYTRLDGILE